MAQKDYVSRGRSGAKRKPTRRKKNSSPKIPKTLVVLAVAVLVVFIGGLYFISHHKSEEAQIMPTHAVRPGNGLPPKPEERWRYIKELENRQLNVQTPTEPTSGGDITTKTQLTPEQRQLLDQMQADMRQQPTQLSEVPYNDPTQSTRSTNTSRQVNNSYQMNNSSQQAVQQPVHQPTRVPQQTPPRQVQPRQEQIARQEQPTRQEQTRTTQPRQEQPKPVQKAPEERRQQMITQAKPESRVEKEKPKPQALAENSPEKEPPKPQEKTQRFLVQCGSFHGAEQAESARARLAFEGFEGRISTGGGWNRVVIGPFNNRTSTNNVLDRLKQSGISGCIPLATGG